MSGIGDLLDQVDPADLQHPGQGLLPGSKAHNLLRKSLHTPHSPVKALSASGACVCGSDVGAAPCAPAPAVYVAHHAGQILRPAGRGRLMDASYQEVLAEMGAIFQMAQVIADVTRWSWCWCWCWCWC